MQKRNVAAVLPAELNAEATEFVVQVQLPEKWVQEEEKLRNERNEVEPLQEKVQRLAPGLDLKRFYL